MPDHKHVEKAVSESLERHGITDDPLFTIVLRDAVWRVADLELAEQKLAIKGFFKVAKDLVDALDLGPFDEVISVAIKGPDGQIRVVQIGDR